MVLGLLLLGSSLAKADQTLNPGDNVASSLSSAAGGTTVFLNAGSYGTVDLSDIKKSGKVTIASASGNFTASLFLKNGLNEDQSAPAQTQNLKFQNLTIEGIDVIGLADVSFVSNKFTGACSLRVSRSVPNAKILFDGNTFDDIHYGLWEGRLTVRGYDNTQPVGVKIINNHFGNSSSAVGESDGVQIIGGAYGVEIGPGNEFVGIRQGGFSAHVDPIQLYGSKFTVIRGNYMHGCDTGVMAPDGTDHELIEQNVIDPVDYPYPIIMGSDQGSIIRHNTFPDGPAAWGMRKGILRIGSNEGNPPSTGTVVEDNVLGEVAVQAGSSVSVNFNLIANGAAIGSQDIHGLPTYVGGAPVNYVGYALAAGSLGRGNASDGTDRGITSGLQARIFYVDAGSLLASDANTGTDTNAPWKTIQKAATTMTPGDTTLVRKGTYNETITTANSGTATGYITFQNYGADAVNITGVFDVKNNYVIVRGFEFSGGNGRIEVSGSGNRIIGNYIHHASYGSGLSMEGGGNLVQSNRIANNGAGWGEQTWFAGTNNVFEFNDVSDPEGKGEDLMKFGGRNNTIQNNYFHDLDETGRHNDVFQCGGEEAIDISFRNNLILNIGGQFGMLSTWTGLPLRNFTFKGNICSMKATGGGVGFNVLGVTGLKFVNNTFNCGTPILLRADGAIASTGAVIMNNIFYNGYFGYDSVSTPASADYNLIYPDPTGQWGAPPKKPHDIWGLNPKFVDAVNYDFHLQAGSPAIDSGFSVDIAADRDGVFRPQGLAWDIGAFEYSSSASNPPAVLLQPTNATVAVGQPASFSVTASGAVLLAYQWQRNAANISGATNASYTTPAAMLADDGSGFRVIVTNSFGSVTSSVAILTVLDPNAPTVSLTAPTGGASFLSPALITLAATAAGNAGGITNVEFFAGTNRLAGDASAPYSFKWPNVPIGTYQLAARATDATGQSVTSAPVTITVVAPDSRPVIGNPSEGNTADYITDSSGAWINACRFQCVGTRTLTALKAKVGAITGKYQCAIYADSGGVPAALLGATSEITPGTNGWHTFSLRSALVATNGNYYWLAIWSNDTNARVNADDTGGVLRWGKYPYGTNWPNPLTLGTSGSFNSSIYATGPETSAFDQWKSNYNLPAATPAGADTDQDGLPLLLEYALGLDPLQAETKSPVSGSLEGNFLALTYTKIKAATDLTCTAEVAGNVTGPWFSGSNDVDQTWQVGDSLTTQTIVARDKTPVPNATSRFMRLKVTQP